MVNEKRPEQIVDRRYDCVFLFDVKDGNPNGDPDAGNLPRLDPQTLQGIVTDVCIKRKVRDYVLVAERENGKPKPGYAIYIQVRGVLKKEHQNAYTALGINTEGSKKQEDVEKARAFMCKNFYDIRTFGAVMSLKGLNCGQVRGPVQVTFARSIDPIVPQEITIVRKAVATEEDAEKQIGRDGDITGTMGRKSVVPYGLYRAHIFVNPFQAERTGFTYADLELFFRALEKMFDFNRSASKGLMSTRRIYVFEHPNKLGKAPAHELLEKIRIEPLGPDKPPRSFEDYKDRIQVPEEAELSGVKLYNLPKEHDKLFPWLTEATA